MKFLLITFTSVYSAYFFTAADGINITSGPPNSAVVAFQQPSELNCQVDKNVSVTWTLEPVGGSRFPGSIVNIYKENVAGQYRLEEKVICNKPNQIPRFIHTLVVGVMGSVSQESLAGYSNKTINISSSKNLNENQNGDKLDNTSTAVNAEAIDKNNRNKSSSNNSSNNNNNNNTKSKEGVYLRQAGIYSCIVPKSSNNCSAHLVVLASEPSCYVTPCQSPMRWCNASCNVNYNGSWAPIMTWTLTTGRGVDVPIKDNQVTNITTNNSITYIIDVTLIDVENGSILTCLTHFTSVTKPYIKYFNFCSDKPPEYMFQWTTTMIIRAHSQEDITVLYPPSISDANDYKRLFSSFVPMKVVVGTIVPCILLFVVIVIILAVIARRQNKTVEVVNVKTSASENMTVSHFCCPDTNRTSEPDKNESLAKVVISFQEFGTYAEISSVTEPADILQPKITSSQATALGTPTPQSAACISSTDSDKFDPAYSQINKDECSKPSMLPSASTARQKLEDRTPTLQIDKLEKSEIQNKSAAVKNRVEHRESGFDESLAAKIPLYSEVTKKKTIGCFKSSLDGEGQMKTPPPVAAKPKLKKHAFVNDTVINSTEKPEEMKPSFPQKQDSRVLNIRTSESESLLDNKNNEEMVASYSLAQQLESKSFHGNNAIESRNWRKHNVAQSLCVVSIKEHQQHAKDANSSVLGGGQSVEKFHTTDARPNYNEDADFSEIYQTNKAILSTTFV